MKRSGAHGLVPRAALLMAALWTAALACSTPPERLPEGEFPPYQVELDASDRRDDARAARDSSPYDLPSWASRRCPERPLDRDAGTWTEHSDGGACFLENTCHPGGYLQPGVLCDDMIVCFDQPYEGELPGRFADACRPATDASECCSYHGPLNADSYHRRTIDPAAMDEICELTALGAHVQCMVWLN